MMTMSWEALASDIKNGRFVPFIGAGLSAARDEQALTKLMELEKNDMTEVVLRSTPGGLSAYRFGRLCKSVKKDCTKTAILRAIVKNVWMDISTGPSWTDLYDEWCGADKMKTFDIGNEEKAIADFQDGLLSLISELDRTAWSKAKPGVGSALAPWLEGANFNIDISSQKAIKDHMNKCLKAAVDLSEFVQDKTLAKRLCPKSILNGLSNLAAIIFYPSYDWAPKKAQKALKAALVSVRECLNEVSREQVEWMVSLLWHLCRFDDPLLPSSRELAFRLTVKMNTPYTVMGELGQIADLVAISPDNEEDIPFAKNIDEVIVDWITYCHQKSEENVSSYYENMARAFCLIYASHNGKWEIPIEKPEEALPLLFTTNYDESMERALRNVDGAGWKYVHILFPLIRKMDAPNSYKRIFFRSRGTPSSDQEPETREGKTEKLPTVWAVQSWMMGAPEPSPPEIVWRDHSTQQDVGASGPIETTFAHIVNKLPGPGPIVIKLHGAPSVPLQKLKDEFRHMTLITESGYVKVMAEFGIHDKMPMQALNSVMIGRRLWFIGYSLSDWNVRSQLYLQLQYRRIENNPLLGTVSEVRAVMDRADPFKEAHCDFLGIKIHKGTIANFFSQLDNQS